MPRKKKVNMYFTQETEDAIVEYNTTNDPIRKNIIYTKHIHEPFSKLSENILNTFKFSYFDVPKIDVQMEVVSMLIEKMHMYKQESGKAFSYFSIIAKNYLILRNNNNYKRYKNTLVISEMPESWNPEDDFHFKEVDRDYIEFNKLMLEYWELNLTKIFCRKRDIQIADSILELFRRSNYIESFNKKNLYLLVREMTNCKTYYITKIISIMKRYQDKLLDEYLTTGTVSMVNDDFWLSEYLYETDSDTDVLCDFFTYSDE
jgi:hypothetical protein